MDDQQPQLTAGEVTALVDAAQQAIGSGGGTWFLAGTADDVTNGTALDYGEEVVAFLHQIAPLLHLQRVHILRALHERDNAAAPMLAILLAAWEAGELAGYDAGYEYAITEAIGETADERAMLEAAQQLASRMRRPLANAA